MSYTIPITGVAVSALLAGVVYTTTRNPESSANLASKNQANTVSTAYAESNTDQTSSGAETESLERVTPEVISKLVLKGAGVAESAQANNIDAAGINATGSGTASLEIGDFAQSIAREYMDDAAIIEQAKLLKDDPARLAAVLDEFSTETDGLRLDRLRVLLGQLDDPNLVGVAESMVYSGNPVSSNSALKLLRDIAPNVPAAQEVGLGVLSSTQDPQLLVGAASIFVSIGSANVATTDRVVSSFSALVQHPDAAVRRASFSTLARWSKDPSVTPTLLQGLNDADPNVRKSTAYGFVGYKHVDASVISALIRTAGNSSESNRTRSGALLALKGMPLNDSQRAQMQAAKDQL